MASGLNTACTVNLQAHATDERRFVAGQLQDRIGHIQRRGEAPKRNAGKKLCCVCSSVSGPAENSAAKPVSGLNTGLMRFTRMFVGPQYCGQRLGGSDHRANAAAGAGHDDGFVFYAHGRIGG